MVFSSEIFLFAFLPLVLALYVAAPDARSKKNLVLVGASLVFYAWGGGSFVVLIVALALVNYAFGLALSRMPGDATRNRRLVAGAAVAVDLATLIWFKYAGFLSDNVALLAGRGAEHDALSKVYLPLGISFFTFHAISYVVDVYRRTSEARRNPLEVVLYFTFFPQLIAGPIVRYKDIAAQLSRHPVTLEDFAYGARRFVVGLAKKVLIANTLGATVDRVFNTAPGTLSSGAAWFALLAYALQIYFDFSGYSDMAIGLARMFGFRFLENFNFPYIAGSVREFWQRWHISLSRWFRDYLYVPLGGNRVAPWRVYLNLLIVFFLCGLWHGAKWTFVVWGLIHGLFLVLERLGAMRRITSTPGLGNVYTLAVVTFAWVFFRSDSFAYALGFLHALVAPSAAPALTFAGAADHETVLVFAIGCVLATPLVARRVEALLAAEPPRARGLIAALPAVLAAFFVVSAVKIAVGTYNPFIYFRF